MRKSLNRPCRRHWSLTFQSKTTAGCGDYEDHIICSDVEKSSFENANAIQKTWDYHYSQVYLKIHICDGTTELRGYFLGPRLTARHG